MPIIAVSANEYNVDDYYSICLAYGPECFVSTQDQEYNFTIPVTGFVDS